MNSTIVNKIFKRTMTIQLLTALTAILGTVVDGIVTAACLGTSAMTAYGFAAPITTIFSGLSGVFGTGISVLCGRTIGAGDKKETNRVFSICMTVSILFSILMMGITYFFAPGIASLLGAKGAEYEEVVNYLHGFAVSAPAIILVIELLPIMQIDSDRNRALYAIGIATAVNIAGDFLNGLVLKKGLFVMAMATTISYYVAAAILLLHFRRKDTMFKFTLTSFDFKVIGEMFSYGIPNAMQQVFRSFLTICINLIICSVADESCVAAYTAIFTLSMLCMAVGTGVSQSTSIITGIMIGEKDIASVRMTLKQAFRTTALLNTILSVIIIIASPVIMSLYFHADPGVGDIATVGLRFYSVCLIFYGLNVALRSYYQAMHMVKLAYSYVVLDNFLCTAVSAYVLGHLFGLNGVWLSFLAGELLTLAIFLLIGHLDRNGEDFLGRLMHIRPEHTAGIKAISTWSAASMEEVETISCEVRDFCMNNSAESRTAYFMSLAAEEIGVNIIRYGFSDGKPHSIDVKLIRQESGWLLRFRDDCEMFDPVKYLECYDDTSPESHIGIRMISRLAERMDYISTLKINNLLIEIKE